jgi:hypothetical protein
MAETAITGSQRGYGRLGADYWRVVKDKKGQRMGRSHERFPESTWRNLFIPEASLAPGPEGPVATDRMEAYRMGVQECEARIVLEYGLARKRDKLGEDLARRCEEHLADRHMQLWMSLSSLQYFQKRPERGPKEEVSAVHWRGGTNYGGSSWYLGSGHQLRTEELFALAGEVTEKIGPLPPNVSDKDAGWSISAKDYAKPQKQ